MLFRSEICHSYWIAYIGRNCGD